jgi:hypothetical protein
VDGVNSFEPSDLDSSQEQVRGLCLDLWDSTSQHNNKFVIQKIFDVIKNLKFEYNMDIIRK